LSVLVSGDGSAVWLCFRCGLRGGQRGERALLTTVRNGGCAKPARKTGDTLAHARSIWQAARPLAGTLGAEYLELRRCLLPPEAGDLRFHPALYCSEVKAELPALIARVSTVVGNRAVGVHRIWLRKGEAKAVAKMRLGGAPNDAVCIRLWPDDAVEATLGIAEGVETALAAANRFRPMWSTIDCGQMARFPLLPGVGSLTIFADFDSAGLKAAQAAQERYFMAGMVAQIVRPRVAGQDYNDVMMRAQYETRHRR